jgi:uncharacterized OsmC-like protein
MKPLPHRYDVQLAGGPSGYAHLTTQGLPGLLTAPPPAYDGPGDAWSPEHLLLASVQACFLFTFRAVARAAKLEFRRLTVDAEGVVDRQDGVTRFTEIVLRPRIAAAAGMDRDRVLQAMERTKKACLVSATLATPVTLDPVVEIEEAA